MNTRYLTLGIFVVVTLGSLGALAWFLDALPESGKTYRVRLDDAAGLVSGNAVRIAGVQVGKIASIGVDGNQAVLELRIYHNAKIFEEACASPQMKGLLGEKFLALRQPATGAELRSGADIACVDPSVDIGEALNAMNGVVDGKESLYQPVARIINRMDTLAGKLEGQDFPTDRIDRVAADVEAILSTTRGMLEDNREDVRALARRSRELLENPKIDRILDKTDKLLTRLDRDLPTLLDKLDKLLDKADKLLDDVGGDKQVAQIHKMLADGEVAVKNLRKISDDFKDIAVTTAPLLRDLATIAKRAAKINEKVIRQVLQLEGFKVHFMGTPWGVKKMVKEMPDE